MKIKVTQEDINEGEKRNCSNCPVSLAIQRAIGNKLVTVGSYGSWRINGLKQSNLGEKVSKWIRGFDKGGDVVPFEFEIELIN